MREHLIGETKIGKITPSRSKKIVYPFARFPKDYTEIIGHKVSIYVLEDAAGHVEFRLVLDDDSIIRDKVKQRNAAHDLETRVSKLENMMKRLGKK